MKWQPIPIVSRLVCLSFGVFGLPAIWALCSASSDATDPASPVNLLLVAIGTLTFLAAGIVGRYPAQWDPPPTESERYFRDRSWPDIAVIVAAPILCIAIIYLWGWWHGW